MDQDQERQVQQSPLAGRGPICQVFISHRGPDVKRNFAAWLQRSLNKKGMDAFLDDRSLKLGSDADSRMQAAVKAAKIVIFVLTEGFFQSEWTLQELQWACDALAASASQPSHQRIKLYAVYYGISPDDQAKMLEHITERFGKKYADTLADCMSTLFRTTGLRAEKHDRYRHCPSPLLEHLRQCLSCTA